MMLLGRANSSLCLILSCLSLSLVFLGQCFVFAEPLEMAVGKKAPTDDQQSEEQSTKIYSSFDESANIDAGLKTEEEELVDNQRVLVSVTETGEAGVAFTLVDSSTAELQRHANVGVSSSIKAAPAPVNASFFNGTPHGPPFNTSETPTTETAVPATDRTVYVVRAEPKVVSASKQKVGSQVESQGASSKETAESEKELSSASVPSLPSPPSGINDSSVIIAPTAEAPQSHEDIPSFNEWAQKQLAEAEKKRGENGTFPPGSNVGIRKLRSKNYASPDCGAKVLAANPEAKSPGQLLSPSRDEYLLNTCNSRIWFVVELCEAIQVKKVELANFELFSSSPKNFTVSVSDRFPSRDWTIVGHLTAKDERVVQSFNLQHFQFAKYVRVELHSHYGSEHFCPISLFRVYGTSEIEVLDTVDEAQIVAITEDDDDDEEGEKPSTEDKGKKDGSQNLFGTARDAVMSIVKKAAQALGSGSENRVGLAENTNVSRLFALSCTTPSHIIVCDNCTEQLFQRVYNLISCHGSALNQLLNSSLVYKTLIHSDICKNYGLDFSSLRHGMQYPELNEKESDPLNISSYLSVMLPNDYLAAICNFIAVKEKKVVLNTSDENAVKMNDTQGTAEGCSTKEELKVILPELASTCSVDESKDPFQSSTILHPEYPETPIDIPQSASVSTPSVLSQIKPTKTLVSDVEPSSQNKSGSNKEEVAVESSVLVSKSQQVENNSDSSVVPNAPEVIENESNSTEKSMESLDESIEPIDSETYDKLFSDLDEPEEASLSPPSASPPMPKETVFVRLANRIKALERNMSLSGQYLEELSRRYKKQVEEMQRALSASIEERRRVEEKEQAQLVQLESLTNRVDVLTESVKTLLEERNSWTYKASMIGQHSVLIFVEIAVFIGVLLICRWIPEVEVSKRKISVGLRRNQAYQTRRKSFDSIVPPSHLKKRRPSEEALRIAGAAHQDLLIGEASQNQGTMKTEMKKRRRKKREMTVKSASSSAILTTAGVMPATVKPGSDQIAFVKPVPVDFGVRWQDQVSSPPAPSSMVEQELTSSNGQREMITPVYFKTALSSRNQRSSQISMLDPLTNTNGAQSSESEVTPSLSNVSDSQSNSSTPVKDRKRSVGLKKIVKKFF